MRDVHGNSIRFAWMIALLAGSPCSIAVADDICPYGKLKWADFQGPVPGNSNLDAETDGGVNATWSSTVPKDEGNGSFSSTLGGISSKAEFNKSTSWVRGGSGSDSLLMHEQYHMDIYEAWARKTEQALKGVKGTGSSAAAANADANAKGAAAVQKTKEDCDKIQSAYDTETDHGTNKDKQAEWCKKIAEMLTPAAPDRAAGQSNNSGAQYNSSGESMNVPNATLNAFYHLGAPLSDPFLLGASLQLPTLFFGGDRMPNTPWFFPSVNSAHVVLLAPNAMPVLQGELRVLIGSDGSQQFRGWIEHPEIDPLALQQSPFLQLVAGLAGTGTGVLAVELNLAVPMDVATAGWTASAFVPGQLVIGTTAEHLQPVPVSGPWLAILALLMIAGVWRARIAWSPGREHHRQ